MKRLAASVGFAVVFTFAGNASAEEPVKLQLRIEPATNNAELGQLMRQNTVRVALQRHRLWQEAAQRELDREEKQLREQKQPREEKQLREEKQAHEQKKLQPQPRKETGEAAGAPRAPQTGDDVAIEGDGRGDKKGAGDEVREQHRNDNQKRPGKQGEEGKASGAVDRAQLRNMLRDDRVSSGEGDALEQKLKQRLREHKRQTDRAKSGEQHQNRKGSPSGSGAGSGQGKRSGR